MTRAGAHVLQEAPERDPHLEGRFAGQRRGRSCRRFCGRSRRRRHRRSRRSQRRCGRRASYYMHEQAHELYVEAVLSKRPGEELDLIEGVEVQVVGIRVFICLFIGDHRQLAERDT